MYVELPSVLWKTILTKLNNEDYDEPVLRKTF
jgi:hypothetical protein